MTNVQTIPVDDEPIELCKLLKIANLVSGGGEAGIVITQGYVTVNNDVIVQKRKKIYQQDIVEFNQEKIAISVEKKTKPKEITKKNKNSTNKKRKQTEHKQENTSVSQPAKVKRKPISFG